MKLLAIESSAVTASVAVYEEGKLLAQAYNNTKLTHSQTLMPMIVNMLDSASLTLNEMDQFAVAVGPGSFTGVRIGVSAVKGLAFGAGKPCVPVSTLEAMAYLFVGQDVNVCAVMDARCNQTYNALFRVEGDDVARLTEDRALSVADLAEELAASEKAWVLTGDGADVFFAKIREICPKVTIAPPHLRFQQAFGVALAAEKAAQEGQIVSAEGLMPVYLRMPQAERELKKKTEA